jgi:hypothetical protein
MSKLSNNKKLVEAVLAAEYHQTSPVEWVDGKHPVGKFTINGHKFTYSVDCSPKAAWTTTLTSSMLHKALREKAVMWGYINDPSEFKSRFGKKG